MQNYVLKTFLLFFYFAAADSRELARSLIKGTAGVDCSGAVHQGQPGEDRIHHRPESVVVPSPAPANLLPATQFTSCLLCMSAVPLDAPPHVGIQADMHPAWLWQTAHKGWALQDHPEGLGHRWLVLDGHGVPELPEMSEEGSGLVSGRAEAAGSGS